MAGKISIKFWTNQPLNLIVNGNLQYVKGQWKLAYLDHSVNSACVEITARIIQQFIQLAQ